jgi:hypothetical protein
MEMAMSPTTTRRQRQIVEILRLSRDGDDRRAAALAAEHLDEFPDDVASLYVVDRWFDDRQDQQHSNPH